MEYAIKVPQIREYPVPFLHKHIWVLYIVCAMCVCGVLCVCILWGCNKNETMMMRMMTLNARTQDTVARCSVVFTTLEYDGVCVCTVNTQSTLWGFHLTEFIY